MAKSRRKPWYLKKKTGKIGFKSKHTSRDFDDPIYVAWRKAIRTRDKYKCQMPHCMKTSRTIQIHHIFPWSTHPHLRYVTYNGICLCADCHKRIKGQEIAWASLLNGIALQNELKNPCGPLKIKPRKIYKPRKK